MEGTHQMDPVIDYNKTMVNFERAIDHHSRALVHSCTLIDAKNVVDCFQAIKRDYVL